MVIRRDLKTCSRQSERHHGVRVRVFFVGRRSTTAETTAAAAAYLGFTTYMFCFLIFVLLIVTFLRVLYNNIHHLVNQRSKFHTYSAEVSVLHTPVGVRFSMTCRCAHGQGKRGNVHIPAIMSVAFPDVAISQSKGQKSTQPKTTAAIDVRSFAV